MEKNKRETEQNRDFVKKTKTKDTDSLTGSIKDNAGDDEEVLKNLNFNALGVIFKLKLSDDDDYEIDVRQLLRTRQQSAVSDAEELPLKMAQLGLLIGKLKANTKRMDLKRKRMYGVIFRELRDDAENKKMTDTALSKLVEQNKEYRILNRQVINDEESIYNLEQIYWSLKEKSDMLKILLPHY